MYVSLHNRSAYSFGSSLSQPAELAAQAARYHMPAIAVTDLDGLYGAIPLHLACQQIALQHGVTVQPIIGVEFKLVGQATLVLLAISQKGYGHLCRLVSWRHLRDRFITADDLAEHEEDLVCLYGGDPDHRRSSDTNYRHLTELREIFGTHLYAELAIHCAEDMPAVRRLARMADELDIPVVAGCESRCLHRDQMNTVRALASVGSLTLLDQPHPDKPEGTWHLRSPEELQKLFARRPDALTNTLAIAEMCRFDFDLNRNRFPTCGTPDNRSATEYLRELCVAGCRRRYIDEPPAQGMGGLRPTLTEALERVDRELRIIEEVHYAEYFLVFHEIVQYCRAQGIATLARGSAADSLVCYVLGVSHACPFRFDLPFDRFLNPERAKFSKMADIDLDLPWDKRDEVIRWVYDRWGHDRVAMIGSPNKFHGRAAVAELGKVFGLPPHEVHRATKLLPRTAAWNLARAIELSPESRMFPIADEPYRSIIAMAGALEGLPRHWSMHPCGLVVSPEPLTDLVPVQRSPKGPLVAQYDMDVIETLGFIKIDLLGQAGLSVLRDTVAELKRTDDVTVDLSRDVDYRDADTWNMIATGGARGVHHIESPAMTSLLQQCNCRDIDCLTTIVAIIRPGAANQGKKDAFARRHQGFEQPHYAHPTLIPVLEKTYGLMVFEEHILQTAVDFAQMNIGRADTLRRGLNKQKPKLIAEMKEEFYRCAQHIGRAAEEIDAVWQQLEGFAGFMFNKAHSAEYAVEAFQGAWLKYRRPAHYLAAILSNYRGFYAHSPTLPQILYVLEALRLGIGLLPPCVNRSRERFSVEYMKTDTGSLHNLRRTMIRVPVSHINGLSQSLLDRYHAERCRRPFNSLEDFLHRCRPAAADSQLLLDSGALDGFALSRPAMFWQLRRPARTRQADQAGLWDNASHSPSTTVAIEEPPVEFTSPDRRQIAQREMDLLGFPITIDPLTFLGTDDTGRTIDWTQYVPVNQLGQYVHRTATICGLMVADRVNVATTGDLMKFVTLADRTGFVETFLFPEAYQKFGHLTVAHPILAATGRVEPFENRNGFAFRVEQVAIPERR